MLLRSTYVPFRLSAHLSPDCPVSTSFVTANNESIVPNSLRRHINLCLVLEQNKQRRTITCALRGLQFWSHDSNVPSQSSTFHSTVAHHPTFSCIFVLSFVLISLLDLNMFFHGSGGVSLCHNEEDRHRYNSADPLFVSLHK